MAAGGRVSIPAVARPTVADIKEVAGGHTDEEVYAMLRECNMDPNETAQRLLLQDTFHEVKRKRDKKKEGSKEPSDSRWKPAIQGRGGKSGRGNYASRSLSSSNDSAGRSAISGKEIGSGSTPVINADMDVKASTSLPSSASVLRDGPPQPFDPAAVVVTSPSAVSDTIKSGSAASSELAGVLLSQDVVAAIGPNALQSQKPASPSDPVVVPSLNSYSLGDVGSSRQAIGSNKTSVVHKVGHNVPTDKKGSSQQSVLPSFGRSFGGRPSSSYSSHSQQSCGSQKVTPSKEWKPKPTSSAASRTTEGVTIPDEVPLAAETIPQSAPKSDTVGNVDLLKLDKSFNHLQLSDKQHVIIPDHLQVSESEKYGLSFGSFNTSFHQTMAASDPECANSPLPQYSLSHELICSDHEPQSMQKDHNSSSPIQEDADLVPQQLPSAKLENCAPSAMEISSIAPTESDECRDDSTTSGVPQSAAIHNTPSYLTFGLASQPQGNQIAVIEKSESQGSNSPAIASSVSASVATPAAGVAISHQPAPVFRQHLGVYIPNFPTNYVQYNQYISPFFIPPPTLQPFMSNATFPQPPSTGSMYPAPGSTGILPPVKYSVPSFKPSGNNGSQASIGIPGSYGTYGSSPSVYTNNTTLSSGNPAEKDDVSSSQIKESSTYIAGPQMEGSTLWITTPIPGRDISALQANSFYGLPPQGQQVTFTPQAGHSPFGGIYHPEHTLAGAAVHPLFQPSQTMAGAVEIVGAPGSVYQHPQAQMNWGGH